MLPAGTYYIGDLCYVMHDEWDEVIELIFPKDHPNPLPNQGEFTLEDGRKFAMYSTRWGDGTYQDQEGRSYSVDAGSIGCILLSDIDREFPLNEIKGGQVLDFTEPFNTSSDGSNIVFGNIRIDTDPNDIG